MKKVKILALSSGLSLLFISNLFLGKSSINLVKAYASTTNESKAVVTILDENSKIDISRRLFEQYINDNKTSIAGVNSNGVLSNDVVETLTDYKINDIRLVQSEEDSFIVNVSYDIQFTEESNKWIAGNGKVNENNWIRNKSNYVEIVKDNDDYKINRICT